MSLLSSLSLISLLISNIELTSSLLLLISVVDSLSLFFCSLHDSFLARLDKPFHESLLILFDRYFELDLHELLACVI